MLARTLLAAVAAMVALATVSACSGGSTTEEATSSASPAQTAKGFPQSASYLADMTAADGKTMTLGITVDGDRVAAYACNGTDDEAWFFGTQTNGKMALNSRFRDTLTADFDGTNLTGDLTMDGVTYPFTAAPVSGEAGVYTADTDGVRATWIVRPDGSAVGVQFDTSSVGDTTQADIQQLQDAAFRNQVRNRRQLQQAQQITRLSDGKMSSTINGRQVTPTRVTGTFRLG